MFSAEVAKEIVKGLFKGFQAFDMNRTDCGAQVGRKEAESGTVCLTISVNLVDRLTSRNSSLGQHEEGSYL